MLLKRPARPSRSQKAWLRRGLDQPGGKLPLFNREGQEYSSRTIKSCIDQGWAEPWFNNPLKPDWLVCKLTDSGRMIASLPDTERAKTREEVSEKRPQAIAGRAQSQISLI
ncbi:hypothetical protein [Pelagibius sp. Alg239-R121]|uniref:hypothetical protein n=1 Tax=Pelagibius sp. Alg239-R121 TaxID=2993448 RepID=UPI0024A6D23A|nr:hypothetical protein [Pelagibius sp. Alg239-R121]